MFAPLDNKDYSPYFGQIRGAKPTVIYTSVAGNDTVRLFTQMAEFGLNRNVQVVGASGTVTSQNLQAIGKADIVFDEAGNQRQCAELGQRFDGIELSERFECAEMHDGLLPLWSNGDCGGKSHRRFCIIGP